MNIIYETFQLGFVYFLARHIKLFFIFSHISTADASQKIILAQMSTAPLQPSNVPHTINTLPNESIDHGIESPSNEVCSDTSHCKSRLSVFCSTLTMSLQQQHHQSGQGQ